MAKELRSRLPQVLTVAHGVENHQQFAPAGERRLGLYLMESGSPLKGHS